MRCKPVRQIYYNPGNGYTVASFQTEEELPQKVVMQGSGSYGIFQAIGTELPTNEGLELELEGEWKDGKFGLQYRVSHFNIQMPTSEEGIQAYLSSNLIKGIGPVTAANIVARFGKDTFYVLDHTPEKLLQVRGVTDTKLKEIMDGYQKSKSIRDLMVYMAPFGVTPRKAALIQEHFKDAAVSIVKENPFRLCEIKGFGFMTVDPIAIQAKNFRADDPLRIKAAITYLMEQAQGEGHLFLIADEILERADKLLNHKNTTEIVSERAIRDAGNEMIHKDGSLICNAGAFYMKKSFQAEMGAAAMLVKLCLQKDAKRNVDRVLRLVQQREKIILNAKQQEAIKMAFEHPVSIITGGPGRGKTTIIRFIIAVQEELDKNAMILLCAPTGKASRKMNESTGYPAMTIHKAVGLTGEAGEEEWNGKNSMPDDLIIADEFSMVDMFLADKLFSSIKLGARLVMVGDQDQIESVGPGNVFKEMIASGKIPITVLDECFRQEEDSTIIKNADKINANRMDLRFDDTFRFYTASDDSDAAEIIRKIYQEELGRDGENADSVQVLSPLRKDTKAGSDALNEMLREIVNPKRKGYPEITNGTRSYRQGDKVMQIKNNDEVSNGDVGEVLNIYKEEGHSRMRVDFGDDRIMTYDEEEYWPLTHAYAMTIHKSQGSEYPVVIVPMLPCFRRMLRRNIFYTAVTRAKEKVIIVGSKRAMAQAIRTDYTAKRNTRFAYLIQKIMDAALDQEKKSA